MLLELLNLSTVLKFCPLLHCPKCMNKEEKSYVLPVLTVLYFKLTHAQQ